ncbi:MAG TPA: type II toxin-antitoxin system VapC family toxin [Candidatus Saccharimonadales bacterium]|jgi:predicted nucleic acid-binding protein
MSYLLDTNSLSEISKPQPNQGFMEWFERADSIDLYASCIAFGEIYKGIELLPDSAKRRRLEKRTAEILEVFGERMFMVDLDTAILWSQLMAQGLKNGRSAPAIDSLIAAQCLQHKMALVTRNVKDFEQFSGLQVYCPWSTHQP